MNTAHRKKQQQQIIRTQASKNGEKKRLNAEPQRTEFVRKALDYNFITLNHV